MDSRRIKKEGRRSIRLKNFNYSWPGFYFVTICVKDRSCVLGEISENIENPKINLSNLGKIVKDVWKSIPQHHKVVELYEYAIMPNHLHGIIHIKSRGIARRGIARGDKIRRGIARYAPTDYAPINVRTDYAPDGKRKFIKQPSGSLPTIIASFKSEASKQIHLIPGWESFSWQRNYYEHVVRTEKALLNIQNYIIDNPRKWQEDIENPKNKTCKYQLNKYYKDMFFALNTR